MRSVMAACVVAALAWSGSAGAADRVTVAGLLADPARLDGRDVLVEGVAGAGQWLYVTVLGNPTDQAWFPAFLLTDGPSAVWVVVRYPAFGHTTSNMTVPPTGARVEIQGIFRAGSRTVEMDRPSKIIP